MRRIKPLKGSANRGGRPPRNRKRHTYNPRLELEVYNRLADQAQHVGISLAAYAELLVAEAHGYSGEYLATLDSLPSRVSAATLRSRSQRRATDDYEEYVDGANRRMTFLVDQELADQIDPLTEELDVSYSAYIRSILHDATGFSPRKRRKAIQAVANFEQEGTLIRSA